LSEGRPWLVEETGGARSPGRPFTSEPAERAAATAEGPRDFLRATQQERSADARSSEGGVKEPGGAGRQDAGGDERADEA
jgi:hypothetical protein